MKKRKTGKSKLVSKPDQLLPWIFKDKPESICLTTQFVIDQKAPILTIHHDAEDDIWMFWPYLPHGAKDKVIQTTLNLVVSLYPYVREFADLPLGWMVERPGTNGQWTKKPCEEFIYKEECDFELSDESQ